MLLESHLTAIRLIQTKIIETLAHKSIQNQLSVDETLDICELLVDSGTEQLNSFL